MATSEQARLGEYGVHHYQRGDLLERTGTGRTVKVRLTECPFCASDPKRPRHHFQANDSRAAHFRDQHSVSDV